MSNRDPAQDQVVLPDAPAIPGLAFRRFRSEADYGLLAEVFNAAKDIDGIEITRRSAQDYQKRFSEIPNCDPYQDILIVLVEERGVGFGHTFWNQLADGGLLFHTIGFVHPDWRRQGIGAALLRYSESRLAERAKQYPAGTPMSLATIGYRQMVGHAVMVSKAGYRPIRYFSEMTRATAALLPPAQLLEGLEVRPVQPEQYRAIWNASEEAMEDHWGHTLATEQDYQRWLDSADFQPDLWKVAWDRDQVAGMVLNYVREAENQEYQRRRGHTQGIRVRRPWRRRGLARALLIQSIEMFRDMGMDETYLSVDSESLTGALDLYEGVGYRVIRQIINYRKPLQ